MEQLDEDGEEIKGAFIFDSRIEEDDDDDDWWVPSEDDDDDDDDNDDRRRELKHNYRINENAFQYHIADVDVHKNTRQFKMSVSILGPKLFYLDDLFFGGL